MLHAVGPRGESGPAQAEACLEPGLISLKGYMLLLSSEFPVTAAKFVHSARFIYHDYKFFSIIYFSNLMVTFIS